MVVQSFILADEADALANPHSFFSVPGRQSEDARFARSRMGQAEQHLDGRRLAAAVASQEAVDRAELDRKINPVHGRFLTVALFQIFGFYYQLRHNSPLA